MVDNQVTKNHFILLVKPQIINLFIPLKHNQVFTLFQLHFLNTWLDKNINFSLNYFYFSFLHLNHQILQQLIKWHKLSHTTGTTHVTSASVSGPFFFFTKKNKRVYQLFMKMNEVDQEINETIICLIIKGNHLF